MQNKLRNKAIGKKLRELRLKKDITEGELARLLHKDISIYSRIECGERALQESEAILLADFYEINVDDIYLPKEAVAIDNSFHNSPASGNINSILVPSEVLSSLHEIVKQNTILLNMVAESQQQIIKKGEVT